MLENQMLKIKAYSLLELSIVLVILSILAIGTWNLSAMQVYHANYQTTIKNMRIIEDALIVFLARNGRLPCPASPSQLNLNNTFGMEQVILGTPQACNTTSSNINIYSNTTSNPIYLGAPPITSLGLPDSVMYDGWGNRFAYVVQQAFSNNSITNQDCTTPTQVNSSTPYLCYSGQASNSTANYNGLQILSGYNTASIIATDPVYILISYGHNGYGAFLMSADVDLDGGGVQGPNTDQNPMPPLSNTLELYNLSCSPSTGVCNNTSVNSQFIQGNHTSEFDDIVVFKTRNQLLLDCNKYLNNACMSNYGILAG